MKKKLDKDQIKSIRYLEDKSIDTNLLSSGSNNFTKIKNSFLMNHLPVNKNLTPNIHKSIEDCLSILGLDNSEHDTSIFIYQHHEINAKCFTGFKGNIVILLSSTLIKFLKPCELKFVIGHELGHYLFHKNIQKVPGSLEHFILYRSQEITADRVGLVCCQSLDSAIQAIIKMLSGLDDNHLIFNINSILTEYRNIDGLNIPFEEMYATHPPLPIRARALLWFSMGEIYLKLTEKDTAKCLSKISIDNKVKNDLEKYLNSRCLKQIEKSKKDFTFWVLSLIFLKDYRLDKEEQEIISKLFGIEKLEKLKYFINSSSPEEVIKNISQNCVESFEDYFKHAPKSSILYLNNLDKNLNEKTTSANNLSLLLNKCPELKKYTQSKESYPTPIDDQFVNNKS